MLYILINGNVTKNYCHAYMYAVTLCTMDWVCGMSLIYLSAVVEDKYAVIL